MHLTPFARMLLSYLLILIIPITVTFSVYSSILLKNYAAHLNSTNQSNLETMGVFFENRFNQFFNMSHYSAANTIFSDDIDYDDIPSMRLLQSALRSYKENDDLILDVGLYLPRIDRILTGETIFDPDYIPISIGEIRLLMRRSISFPVFKRYESITHFFASTTDSADIPTFVYPFPLTDNSPESILFVFLDGTSIDRYITTFLGSNKSSGAIYTHDVQEVASAVGGAGPGNIDETDPDAYIVTSIDNPDFLFRYVAATDRYELLRPLRRQRNVFVLFTIALSVAGFFLLYLIIVFNYRPIRNLRSFVEGRLGIHIEDRDELRAIQEAVSEYSDDMNELKTTLQNAGSRHVTSKLVRGEYRSILEFNKAASAYGMELKDGWYCVIMFAFDTNLPAELPRLKSLAEVFSNTINQGVFIPGSDTNELSVVATYPSLPIAADVRSEIVRAQLLLEQKLSLRATIGVGAPCDTVQEIGRSTIQARTCLDYRIINGNYEIFFYEDLERQQSAETLYSRQYVRDIEFFLRDGDSSEIEKLMEKLIAHIQERKYPLFIARCLAYDVINTIIHVAQSENIPMKQLFRQVPMDELQSFGSLENLTKILVQYSDAARSALGIESRRRRSDLATLVKEYIKQHLYEPDFYLQKLAEEYGQSLSYLSQLFKKSHGITMSEYVSRLRIQRAKELLTSTSLNVEEIVSRVGYTDRSSFTRKFKNETGVSPGAYRKLDRSHDAM